MNISPLSQVFAQLQQVAARTLASKPTVGRATEQQVSTTPHAPHSTLPNDGDQDDGAVDPGHAHSRRVATLASRIETRVQHAVEGGNLSAEQVQSIKDAVAQFESLMNRIGNAEFSHSPKRQVHLALSELTQRLHDILHPQPQDQPLSASTPATDTTKPDPTKPTPSIDAVA